MPNRFLCPRCRGQRTASCNRCGGSGKRFIAGITIGKCKECDGTGRRRCDVCGGTGEIEADFSEPREPSGFRRSLLIFDAGFGVRPCLARAMSRPVRAKGYGVRTFTSRREFLEQHDAAMSSCAITLRRHRPSRRAARHGSPFLRDCSNIDLD